MPTPKACPVCQDADPRVLENSTHMSQVTYYRCNQCGTVWNVSKRESGTITVVTRKRTDETN
jgi:uncharacterized Zn finger protein